MALAKMRANMSVVPPAVNGTTTVTVRGGQFSWAAAGAASASTPNAKVVKSFRTSDPPQLG
jgi:hypothetical protein